VVTVTQSERAAYKLDRNRWRLRETPAAAATAVAPSAAPPDAKARLEALEELRKSGLVTDAEYQAKKKSILESL
jgi:hypothetical protein